MKMKKNRVEKKTLGKIILAMHRVAAKWVARCNRLQQIVIDCNILQQTATYQEVLVGLVSETRIYTKEEDLHIDRSAGTFLMGTAALYRVCSTGLR